TRDPCWPAVRRGNPQLHEAAFECYPADEIEIAFSEPKSAILASCDPQCPAGSSARRRPELANDAAGGDPPDGRAVEFGEPKGPVGAGRETGRIGGRRETQVAGGRGDGINREVATGGETPDLVRILGEPQCAVGPSRDRAGRGSRRRNRKLRDRASSRR